MTEPTKGAVRASQAIFGTNPKDAKLVHRNAKLIDLGTSLPDLLKALRLIGDRGGSLSDEQLYEKKGAPQMYVDSRTVARLALTEAAKTLNHRLPVPEVSDWDYFKNSLFERFPGFGEGSDEDVNGGDLVEWMGGYMTESA